MIKPFATSARALTTRPLTWRTWTALVAVPLVVMGLLTWAFWSPETDHGTAQAAVVNNDEPVKVEGQTIPLGRTLAGDLTHDEDSAYDWVLTDADDAQDGLDDGSYAAVVTIPEDFSAKATSAATEDDPLDAVRAGLDVETTSAAGVADPHLAGGVATDMQDALNQTIVETYLDNIYAGFNTMHDQLQQASDGADQLADGTSDLVDGADELADGAGELADGAGELADGSAQLADGTAQLADGSAQLADGAAQLADGTGELADGSAQLADGTAELSSGLDTAARQTARLPAATQQLASGADQVADGNEQLADRVVPLANSAISGIDRLPDAQDGAAELRRLADECADRIAADPDFCADLERAADEAESDAQRLDDGKVQVRGDIVSARDSVEALATGSRQVADGNAELAAQSVDLAAGIASAASGAREVNSGAQDVAAGARQVDSAAQQVASGASELDSGVRQTNEAAHQVADGASELSAGADDLSSGSRQLADGARDVDDGAQQLADGLADAVDQVPTYTDKEKDHLSAVASSPTVANILSTPFGVLSITLFAALALWALALVTYLVTRPVPAGILTSREPTWRITVRAAAPGAIAGASAAAVISVIAVPVLDLHATAAAGFLLVALLAAGTFVALNQALAAIFGPAGRLASLAIAVLAVATGVVSTLPGPLYSIAGFLPTHGAIVALRAVATGSTGLVTGIVELAAWLAVGLLATIIVTDRRRYLTPRRLRLDRAARPQPGAAAV
ncbi:putative membrane protein [Promicromonospora sp. AC04]|uniref:YhgE/Pip domain-containing protein n=1 Tax=Promicromonospora sp. AC04 TaxID=2135723 RepID=UPI000D34CCEB|nr:YhgE/Pip domain-containing protein [Promicromonospora sp. AC04]PUB27617.1 putative membrane protein [Promicromonospora sp. AC04]